MLDQLDLHDVVLVGHDASGPEALDLALTQPDRAGAVVLLNTYYGHDPALHLPEFMALMADPYLRACKHIDLLVVTFDGRSDFESTRARFDEQVPLLDPAATANLVISQPAWSQVQAAITATLGPSGFLAVSRLDQGGGWTPASVDSSQGPGGS